MEDFLGRVAADAIADGKVVSFGENEVGIRVTVADGEHIVQHTVPWRDMRGRQAALVSSDIRHEFRERE